MQPHVVNACLKRSSQRSLINRERESKLNFKKGNDKKEKEKLISYLQINEMRILNTEVDTRNFLMYLI